MEECQYFAFFLGFKPSIRDKMGKLVTLSAPCRQHIPACSSGAWRWRAVGLVGPQAPRDHASRVGHLAGPKRRGQRCHLPRCGARPQLLTDKKAGPACRKDREDLPTHPRATLDGLPATRWEHGLYDRCCHRAQGTTELTKKPVRSLCSPIPAQRSRSSLRHAWTWDHPTSHLSEAPTLRAPPTSTYKQSRADNNPACQNRLLSRPLVVPVSNH